jgi:hypothetical protein
MNMECRRTNKIVVMMLLIMISLFGCSFIDLMPPGPTPIEYDKASGKRFNEPHASVLKAKHLYNKCKRTGSIGYCCDENDPRGSFFCIMGFKLQIDLINDGNAEIMKVFCNVDVYDDSGILVAQRSCERETYQEDLTGKVRDTWSPGEKMSLECYVFAKGSDGRGYDFDPTYVSKLRVTVSKLEILGR